MSLFLLLALGLAAWIATSTIVEAEVFRDIREACDRVHEKCDNWWTYKLRYLVHCHMCTGIWVSALIAIFVPAIASSGLIGWGLTALAIKGVGHSFLVLQKLAESRTDLNRSDTTISKEAQSGMSALGDATAILFDAADDIELYGWKAAGADIDEIDPNGAYPRCVWIGIMRAAESRNSSDVEFHRSSAVLLAEDALVEAAGVNTISDVFDLNDAQCPDEGKQWASNLLDKAADLLIARALSENPKDSVSTEQTESGNTPNVESRVKRFLRKLHLVK